MACSTERIYPIESKVAEIVPFFKKGDRDNLTNYHLISLLSAVNKIFEKMLFSRLNNYLEKFNLLYDKQFGFRQNFLTSLAMSSIQW